MRGFRLVATLLAVLALGAVAAATASAQVEFLPGTAGTKFTGKSKKAKLQVKAGATIECTGSEAEGELLGKTTALFIVTFKGCKSLGLAANSLGDSAGIVKAHIDSEACWINLSPVEAGMLMTPLPIHIEVPQASFLVVVSGSFVTTISPTKKPSNTMTVGITQKGGVQTVDGCRNSANELVKETLLTVENEFGASKQSAEEAVEAGLTFNGGVEEELMA